MAARRPNVILVITDDQGYGDLGCTGNPWLKTPNIDAFHDRSVRLTNFHVSPLCTPTRGALMTGRNPLRNGAWATTWGRSLLGINELTLAQAFAANGYRTGMFGKWHLGDNYPFRPQDRGFDTVVAHRGGGVGQTPDFWGNDYFDDTYFHNGEPVPHSGYCTDVWFSEALRFIEAVGHDPFFCYVSTNAPHAPYLVDERYADPYRGEPEIHEPPFYGMIANIDENFGRLVAALRTRDLERQTILVFMTDNGSSAGCRLDAGQRLISGYNAGMRGMKGSYYEGGHRVPFFMSWPDGGVGGGNDRTELLAHVDVFPTLVDLCGLSVPDLPRLDGTSFAHLIVPDAAARKADPFGDRPVFVQYRQSTHPPQMWENAVLQGRWRLIKGRELYDVDLDPAQANDCARQHPDVVGLLREHHERWWAEVSPGFNDYQRTIVGSDRENPIRLDAFDLMGDCAWSQQHVREALKVCGTWNIHIATGATYEISMSRWPRESQVPLRDIPVDGGVRTPIVSAELRIGRTRCERRVDGNSTDVRFTVPLRSGPAELEAQFVDETGERWSAYYVYSRRLDPA